MARRQGYQAHSAGLVNETYLRKAGKSARYARGKQVEIDDRYHVGSWRLTKKVVVGLASASIAKLATP